MADRRISELTEMPASGVASSDLFLFVDVDNPNINDRSRKFTASGLTDYVYQRLSIEGQPQRFYSDTANSTQRGFFGTAGLNTISGNTISGGTVVTLASGVTLNFSNFQNQNLIDQSTTPPTDSGTIFWYRPPVSGLLGRTYYRYINPTGVGPSAIEWVEASPFEATTIQIGTQQVISGVLDPLRIPAATNNPSGFGGIRFTDVLGQVLNASGVFSTVPIVASGYPGAVPTISGVQEGLPLVKQGNALTYATLSGAVINTDFSSSQVRVARGTQAAPSITFTGDLNTGIYSPTADQVGITVSGFEHFRVARNNVTVSGALNVNNGRLTTESDARINSITVGRGNNSISSNTAIGSGCLSANTTGAYNVAIGSEALVFNQDGNDNVAIGYRNLYFNVNGGGNTSIGAYCLENNQSGTDNTAIGNSALNQNLTGTSNIAIGFASMSQNIDGGYNVAVGHRALESAISNYYSVAIGYQASQFNISGVGNTAIGYRSQAYNDVGFYNTSVGYECLSEVEGVNNSALGYQAGAVTTSGRNNVFLGYRAGYNNTLGNNNTCVGFNAASGITTGSNNTIIGNSPGAPGLSDTVIIAAGTAEKIKVDSSNNTFIGGPIRTISGGSSSAPIYTTSGYPNTGIFFPAADTVAISAGGVERARITNEGRVGIGRTPTTSLLEVAGDASQFQTNIFLQESSHVTSARTAINFNDDWLAVTDTAGNGTKDFGLYSAALVSSVIQVLTNGNTIVNGTLTSNSFIPTSSTVPANGLYLPAANTVGIATGSSERMRIDSNGAVVIGGRGSSRTNLGAVGNTQPGLQMEGTGISRLFSVTSGNSDPTIPGQIIMARHLSGDSTGNTIVNNNTFLGTLTWQGSDGVRFPNAANIFAAVDGSPGVDDMPGRLIFSTTSDGGNIPGERMRIDSLGNVGIGRIALAGFRLDVAGGTRILAQGASSYLEIGTGTLTDQAAYLDLVGDTTYTDYGTRLIRSPGANGDSLLAHRGTGVLSMYAQDAAPVTFVTSSLERMRIDNAGNVKIGGTTDRSTTAGTNQLVIFDGTAPVGTLANGISFYSTAGECRVMDASGASTLLSPHDDDGYWIFDSTDTRNNRRLLVHMEKMAKWIDETFGTSFVEEFGGPPVPN